MDQAYSAGIPAVPYLWMAFGGGSLLMFGYTAWLCVQRRTLRKLLVAVSRNSSIQ